MRPLRAVWLCLAALACAGGEREPQSTPAAAVEDSVPAKRQPLHLARLSVSEPSGFPHDAHRSEPCARCHGRVAGHEGHRELDCRECHPPSPAAATASGDCTSCHHERSRSYGCLHCHDAQTPGRAGDVKGVALAGPAGSPARVLPFSHDRHTKLDCARCHEGRPTAAGAAPCTSCHTQHHRAEADCSACHAPPSATLHPAARVHQGCGGTGCHTDATVLALPFTRSLCVTCHSAQARHEPGLDCATCHQVRQTGGAP